MQARHAQWLISVTLFIPSVRFFLPLLYNNCFQIFFFNNCALCYVYYHMKALEQSFKMSSLSLLQLDYNSSNEQMKIVLRVKKKKSGKNCVVLLLITTKCTEIKISKRVRQNDPAMILLLLLGFKTLFNILVHQCHFQHSA